MSIWTLVVVGDIDIYIYKSVMSVCLSVGPGKFSVMMLMMVMMVMMIMMVMMVMMVMLVMMVMMVNF